MARGARWRERERSRGQLCAYHGELCAVPGSCTGSCQYNSEATPKQLSMRWVMPLVPSDVAAYRAPARRHSPVGRELNVPPQRRRAARRPNFGKVTRPLNSATLTQTVAATRARILRLSRRQARAVGTQARCLSRQRRWANHRAAHNLRRGHAPRTWCDGTWSLHCSQLTLLDACLRLQCYCATRAQSGKRLTD